MSDLPIHPCSLQKVNFEGWNAYELANDLLQVHVVPEIGGRIIQMRLGEDSLLYVNSRLRGKVVPPNLEQPDFAWANYGGSKVWPGPQGWSSDQEWPGPPDPILDGSPFDCRVVEATPDTAAILLTSPHDEYTGLTFSREVRMFSGSTRVQISHTMKNTSRRPVRWSIWQVTQHDAHPGLAIFLPATAYHRMFGDQEYPGITIDEKRKLLRLQYADVVGKFSMNPEAGWLASLDSRNKTVFSESFKLFPESVYPDNAAAEFWVNGFGSCTIHGDRFESKRDDPSWDPFIETEILSPMADLQCGEEYSFTIQWNSAHVNGDEIVRVHHCAAVANPLKVVRYGNQLRATGSFAVFHAGSLELVSLLRSAKIHFVHNLGSATPLVPCVVDVPISDAADLARVCLRLRDSKGRLLGTLDEATATNL